MRRTHTASAPISHPSKISLIHHTKNIIWSQTARQREPTSKNKEWQSQALLHQASTNKMMPGHRVREHHKSKKEQERRNGQHIVWNTQNRADVRRWERLYYYWYQHKQEEGGERYERKRDGRTADEATRRRGRGIHESHTRIKNKLRFTAKDVKVKISTFICACYVALRHEDKYELLFYGGYS